MSMSRNHFLRLSAGGFAGLGALQAGLLSGCFKKSGGPAGIEVIVKKLLLKDTWTIARNSSDYKMNVFVRIKKDGITGYGEAAPNIRYNETQESTEEVIHKARALFESMNPAHYVNMESVFKELDEEQTAAKCALDIALMDWNAKRLGVPLYRMLGLNPLETPLTSFSIGMDTIEVMKRKVREAEQYPILKIKLGKDNDEEIMKAVRSVTDKPVYVDINEGWKDKQEALEKIRWLKTMNVVFAEQPMPSQMLDETRWVRERSPLPIIADEAVKGAADIPQLAEAYDGINIKLMKSGGIQEALRMIWMARSLGMKTMLGCMIESSCGISAAAHLSPLVNWADLDGNLLISNDPFTGLGVVKGKLILNNRPGLGIKGDL